MIPVVSKPRSIDICDHDHGSSTLCHQCQHSRDKVGEVVTMQCSNGSPTAFDASHRPEPLVSTLNDNGQKSESARMNDCCHIS